MARLGLYQALREKRPYKAGRPHGRAGAIWRRMAGQGPIDASVAGDIDRVFQ